MTDGNAKTRFGINPGPLKIVPAAYREAWENIAKDVALDVPPGWRSKWTQGETLRVIFADPSETYEEVAEELGRSPGAVRYRRQAMIHLIRHEHGAPDRVERYRSDPKKHHKHHDYYQVDELLRELGIYDMPVSQQFEIARPLRQPKSSWRGDGLTAALAGGDELRELRREIKRLSREARARNSATKEES
jgi:hypothetical protein